MAIKYLSGKRIQGTAAEIPNIGGVTGWTELGRTTLSSAGDTIDVTGLSTANYPYLMVLQDEIGSGSITGFTSFNADSGSNYAYRTSENGASDGTSTSQANIRLDRGTPNNFIVANISNKADQEKIVIGSCVGIGAAGASNAPQRWEAVGKWANTSDSITSVKISNASSGDFASGSECVVLGAGATGGGATSAWQELADVSLSSGADTLDTTSFTSKKYLWIQAFIPEGAGHHGYIYFNNDTGANYARRGSANGGTDFTTAPDNELNCTHDTNTAKYINLFVINVSDKEKLCVGEYMDSGSAGAGNSTNRIEWAYKWANTSAQISSVKLYNNQASSNDFPSGTTLKVWGFD